MSEPILKIENLKATYGSIVALKGVDLDVYEGEIVTIVGANGAGKTTLLSCISGLMPYQGTITYQGETLGGKIDSAGIVERGIIQIPEGRQIFADLSVYENLKMGAYSRKKGDDWSEDVEKVYKLFPRLEERKDQKGGSLSGGEQQMLAMGRAMMSKPALLMLDEPSMGLAPILVEQIFEMIRQLHAQGTTILLVEQNAQMALSIADRGYVLETGNISLSGTGKELAESEEVKKAYLGG